MVPAKSALLSHPFYPFSGETGKTQFGLISPKIPLKYPKNLFLILKKRKKEGPGKQIPRALSGQNDWDVVVVLKGTITRYLRGICLCPYISRAVVDFQGILLNIVISLGKTEPFPEKRTRKCGKKQNESLIFCEMLVHAARGARRLASNCVGDSQPSAECGRTVL